MKCSRIFLFFVLCWVGIICTGCAMSEEAEPLCVKCGKIATTTLSGTADIMQKNGISISDCSPITSQIYSANICDSCIGRVANIKPDAGFYGETPFYSND